MTAAGAAAAVSNTRSVTVARSRRSSSRGMPVGRLAAMLVVTLMAALYVSPVERYLAVQRELHSQRGLVQRLQTRQAALEAHARALGTRAAVVQCARSRGWAFPGERTWVVTGLPASAGNAC